MAEVVTVRESVICAVLGHQYRRVRASVRHAPPDPVEKTRHGGISR